MCERAPATAARSVVAQTGPPQTSKEREPRLGAGTPTPVPAPPPTSPRSTPGRAIAFSLTGLALAVVAVAAVLLLKKNISPNAAARPQSSNKHRRRSPRPRRRRSPTVHRRHRGDGGQRSCPPSYVGPGFSVSYPAGWSVQDQQQPIPSASTRPGLRRVRATSWSTRRMGVSGTPEYGASGVPRAGTQLLEWHAEQLAGGPLGSGSTSQNNGDEGVDVFSRIATPATPSSAGAHQANSAATTACSRWRSDP